MPAAVSKSPSSPPQKVEQKPEKDRDFSDISTWEKIKYVASKFPIPFGALNPSLQYTPNKWKPASIEWQNTEHLRKDVKWHGISALTAIRLAAFVVFAGLVVAAVFAAPVIGATLTGAALFPGIVVVTLMLFALAYNLLFIIPKPPNADDISFTKGATDIVAEMVKESPSDIFAVQTKIDRNAYEKRKKHAKDGAKENGVEMTNVGKAKQAKPDKPAAEPVKPPQRKPNEPHAANGAQDPIAKDTRKISQTEFAKATKKLCQTTLALNAQMKPQLLATPLGIPAQKHETKTVVMPATSTQMAEKLVQEMGLHPAVLNMANETTPGGTFLTGGTAQEEQLCRQSNLYEALEAAAHANPSLYPIDPFGAIFTPQVTFFKDDANKRNEPFHVDVITSAAYNCQPGGNKPNTPEAYRAGTKKKIEAMFRAASLNGNDSLVLSAFGCGVFGNDPAFISQLYKEVLADLEFEGRFRAVVFAIPGGPNLTAFQTTFPEEAARVPPARPA